MMQSVLKSLIASQSAGYRWIKMCLSPLLLWIHMSVGKALHVATPYFLLLAFTTSPNVLVNACSESTWVLNFTVLFLTTVINCHLKQLTHHLSSNHINNKISDQKSGRSSITLLHVAHNFLQVKILTTEQELSVQFLSIYHACHHLKQTKYGIS